MCMFMWLTVLEHAILFSLIFFLLCLCGYSEVNRVSEVGFVVAMIMTSSYANPTINMP